MIKKVNKNGGNDNFYHRHLNDVKRIQIVCLQNGYEADLGDCADIWDDYSDMLAAGWMGLPENDEELWNIIKNEVKKQSIN